MARQPVGKGQDGETRPGTLSQEDIYIPGSYLKVHSESWGWVQVVEKALVHPGWEHMVASLSGRVLALTVAVGRLGKDMCRLT